MAKLYIKEYASVGSALSDSDLGKEPAYDQTPVAIGGASAASAALQATTVAVRLQCDVACSYIVGVPVGGVNPVATTDNSRLPAEAIECFSVKPGQGYKIAVIANP